MGPSGSSDSRRDAAEDVERLIGLLDRDDVRQSILFAAANTVPLDRLANLPIPSGFTREQTIALVSAVVRTGAVYSPIPDEDGRLHWYVYTHTMRRALSEIDRFCTEESRLHEETSTRAGARFLIQSNVDEAICAAQLDGVNIDYDSAKDLLLMQRQPRTASERLILNQFQLGERLQEMTHLPWTPETLHGLYAQLTAGVPFDRSRTSVGTAPQRDAEAILRGACEYAGSVYRAKCEHPAITACILRTVIAYFAPFPAWNGVMSRIIFRLYALRQGYPVLGSIPVSRSALDLARHPGAIVPSGVFPSGVGPTGSLPTAAADALTQMLDRYHEANATPWLAVQLILLTHALSQFRNRMSWAKVVDEEVRARLHADTSLNHRQRSILGRALRIPSATFRIGYHRTAHGIGYATAHRDFASLVEHGYLVEHTQGRAIVFTAAPDLEERLGSLEQVARIEDYYVELPAELLMYGQAGAAVPE